MACVTVHCPRGQSAQVYRHGQNPKGHDRFRCRDCHRVFQLTYTYIKPVNPELKSRSPKWLSTVPVRDTARTLKVGINTVIRILKNSRHDE